MSTPPPTASVSSTQISFDPASDDSSASHHLIYLITGNPGIIGYYDIFLKTLHELLSNATNSPAAENKNVFHIYGQSLAGFDTEDKPPANSPSPHRASLYSLEDQIQLQLKALEEFRIQSGPRKGQLHDSIIILGHSVGAYILLEIIQRLRRQNSPLKIKAGILLFPTVVHIAKSPNGVTMSTLCRIPNFPKVVHIFSKAAWIVPQTALEWIVGLVARMPNHAAKVTTSFLRSRMCVWQALLLAKEEMECITEDRWDEEIWGVEHEEADSKIQVPKLIFYFGKNDRWVADHTRDTLIATRGQTDELPKSSKPIMLIDEDGVEHGFCLRDSESIAEKVKVWIDTIISDL